MSITTAGPQSAPARLSVVLETKDVCGNPACEVAQPRHKCARCMSICYCSKECQVSHYPDHKSLCKQIAAKFCVVAEPAFIGYDPHDVIDQQLLQEVSGSMEQTDDGRLLPVFFPHKGQATDHIGSEGQYLGVSVDKDTALGVIEEQIADTTDPDQVHLVPLLSGVGRLQQVRGPSEPTFHSPKIFTLQSKGVKGNLCDLILWRRTSLSKDGIVPDQRTSPKHSPTDNANLVLELVCLLDKTVYPTLQLMRAIGNPGALVVRADENLLTWQFKSRYELRAFGENVLQSIATQDTSSQIVTLTSGECIDPHANSTVLMMSPLHVMEAFHRQKIPGNIPRMLGARVFDFAQRDQLHDFIQRQQSKHTQSEYEESEA
eukprot:m.90212 g.90212  ORF g.90212 m.90212 type:complete len:374 (+) comp12912_c0_seq1:215-1336(+)